MCRVIVMGACPHDDHAQSSNWGIFNQHIWGDYNQHSHMRPRTRSNFLALQAFSAEQNHPAAIRQRPRRLVTPDLPVVPPSFCSHQCDRNII